MKKAKLDGTEDEQIEEENEGQNPHAPCVTCSCDSFIFVLMT